jgi:hypothetical protein
MTKKKKEDTPPLDPPSPEVIDALVEYLLDNYDDPVEAFDLLALLDPAPARH